MLDNKEILAKNVALHHIAFSWFGKIFRTQKCEIRIPHIKLPLEGSIPDDEKIFSKNFMGYLIYTTSKCPSTNERYAALNKYRLRYLFSLQPIILVQMLFFKRKRVAEMPSSFPKRRSTVFTCTEREDERADKSRPTITHLLSSWTTTTACVNFPL
jgi:hypothetical protein